MDVPGPPEGLSAFAARVLDQLSISAWLPAAVLVAGLFFLLKVRFNEGDLWATLADVGNTRGSTIVLLGAAVILLTTVTQAFEFTSVRVLEGYWGDGFLRSAAAGVLARIQLRRWRRAVDRRKRALRDSFESAREGLVRAKVSPEVIAYLGADIRDEFPLPSLSDAQEAELNETDWRSSASPELMRRLDALDGVLDRMPRRHRILPTRLGNTMRSYEDTANRLVTGSVSGMVQRVFHRLPRHIQIELDQYRNRLGLYAALVAVTSLLALVAASVVAPSALSAGLILSVLAVVGCAVFYGAAVSSADAYGSLLVEAMQIANAVDSRTT